MVAVAFPHGGLGTKKRAREAPVSPGGSSSITVDPSIAQTAAGPLGDTGGVWDREMSGMK